MKLLICGVVLVCALSLLMERRAEAGAIDWSDSYSAQVDQQQNDASYLSFGFFRNLYSWDRNVSAWQSYTAGTSDDLTGLAFNVSASDAAGSFDLKIYSGKGILPANELHSTTFSWSGQAFSDVYAFDTWFGFELDAPVAQTAGQQYTFSFENLSADDVISFNFSAADNPYSGTLMLQGYQMSDFDVNVSGLPYADTNDDANGPLTHDMAFRTLTVVPEPASLILLGVGSLLVLGGRRR